MKTFGSKSAKAEVLNHWIAFTESFNFSPQEFYTMVEKEFVARKIPSMDMSRVEYAEGGALSDKRVYLRMMRERLAFDVCAAPFGTGYFFSCRAVYVPAVLTLLHVLGALALLGFAGFLLQLIFDWIIAVMILIGFTVMASQILSSTIAFELDDLDKTLIRSPLVGPFYERWFRKETYYRHDTRLAYLELVPKLVKDLAEQVTATRGVKLVSQYQLAPVLGELYKPLRPIPPTPPQPTKP